MVCIQMSLVEAAKVGDLEAEATPESIMLSTMTEEGEKERTDREMVVPWLKFLWETYRAVLDILKTNTKLEHVYHATCIKAFTFCRYVKFCQVVHDFSGAWNCHFRVHRITGQLCLSCCSFLSGSWVFLSAVHIDIAG